jgi:hypothetical protein
VITNKEQTYQGANSAPGHPQTNGQIEKANAYVKRRLQLAVAQGKAKGIEEVLCEILADKNTSQHGTTKQVPWELHNGRLFDQQFEGDEEKLIEEMRRDAHQNLLAAAQYSIENWRKKKGSHNYRLGEKVWVKVPKRVAKKGGDIYLRTATIAQCSQSDTYLLRWGPDGGYINGDGPGQLSKRWISGADLKPFVERAKIRSIQKGKSHSCFHTHQLRQFQHCHVRKRKRKKRKPYQRKGEQRGDYTLKHKQSLSQRSRVRVRTRRRKKGKRNKKKRTRGKGKKRRPHQKSCLSECEVHPKCLPPSNSNWPSNKAKRQQRKGWDKESPGKSKGGAEVGFLLFLCCVLFSCLSFPFFFSEEFVFSFDWLLFLICSFSVFLVFSLYFSGTPLLFL